MKYDDIYFLNAKEALRVATEQNISEESNNLQICYYEGEKIESDLINLIHLPLDTIVSSLENGILRLPTRVSSAGFDISLNEWKAMEGGFLNLLEEAKKLRSKRNQNYFIKSRTNNPNFNDKLRFYISAHSNTRVMQYSSKNIAQTLEHMGYEVYFDLYHGCEDFNCLKNIAEFNPHATININHVQTDFLNENVFSFTWIQDHWATSYLMENPKLRDRDILFHIIEHYGDMLKRKSIKSFYQPFCINSKIFKLRDEIKRENKIVFIGSSYKHAYDDINNEKKEDICKEVYALYLKNGYISSKKRAEIRSKYIIKTIDFSHIMNYIERDLSLEYIVQNNKDLSIEIYGYGWENNKKLEKSYKGPIEYGEKLSKINNSAKYSLSLAGYIMQQRTLEAAGSGAIPLVFDSRKSGADVETQGMMKSFLFFKTLDDLRKALDKNEDIDLSVVINENSFESFVTKMVNHINTF